MIKGNHKKINLGTSSFEKLRSSNSLFVDKTQFIEHFLNEPNDIQLIVRQRRLGKSLNMNMLKCFLTDKENNRDLFKDLYIESSPVWEKINTAPVFHFDFKNINRNEYQEQLFLQIATHIYNTIHVDALVGIHKYKLESYMDKKGRDTTGLLLLTELVYKETGKRSYILIDEYDKLLTDNYNTELYDEIKEYETQLLSAGLKGNEYLEKALLTGVMRVSRESILSGLNNLATYDLFMDKTYTDDFGLTEMEIDSLASLCSFDKESVKDWYNGIKINDFSIYNIYSVLSYIQNGKYRNYWGRSGTVELVLNLMTESRQDAIMQLISAQPIETYLNDRISLHELIADPSDGIFYSLLVQAGYLSLESIDENNYAMLKIPNKELMNVWKEFILSSFVKNENNVRTIFDHIEYLTVFDDDVKYFLTDRLSYFDIGGISSDRAKTSERVYHVFVLGLLSAYEDIAYKKPPISNRESGDGRYDILFERKNYSIISEFKSVANEHELNVAAEEGLKQIDEKRYFADAPKNKPLIKTAIAFCGKQCVVKSQKHTW